MVHVSDDKVAQFKDVCTETNMALVRYPRVKKPIIHAQIQSIEPCEGPFDCWYIVSQDDVFERICSNTRVPLIADIRFGDKGDVIRASVKSTNPGSQRTTLLEWRIGHFEVSRGEDGTVTFDIVADNVGFFQPLIKVNLSKDGFEEESLRTIALTFNEILQEMKRNEEKLADPPSFPLVPTAWEWREIAYKQCMGLE